jgi:hypothetical protein
MIQPRVQLGDRLEVPLDLAFSRSTADWLAKVALMQNQYAEMARCRSSQGACGEVRTFVSSFPQSSGSVSFRTEATLRQSLSGPSSRESLLALQRGSSAVTLIDQVDAAVASANRMLDKIRKIGRAERFPNELLEGATDILPHEHAALEIEIRRIGRRERHLQVGC